MNVIMKKHGWLLTCLCILLILEGVLFSFTVKYTYAGRKENPDHVLTYTKGNLVWDSNTDIDENGCAKFSLFQEYYQNVKTQNGDKVIAPGTESYNVIRLKNNADYTIQYVAVMYSRKEEKNLPVEPELSGQDFTDTDQYPLPDGVERSQVVRAVTGSVEKGTIQDFDIAWKWKYYENDQRDQIDTMLGNKAATEKADDVTVGLYIVIVENENGNSEDIYTDPKIPKTGDSNQILFYIGLMIISGILFVLFWMDRRKERKC